MERVLFDNTVIVLDVQYKYKKTIITRSVQVL